MIFDNRSHNTVRTMEKNRNSSSDLMDFTSEEPDPQNQVPMLQNSTNASNAERGGLHRYFAIVNASKRKRPMPDNNATNATIKVSNRFAALAPTTDNEPKKSRPPPIYLREQSSSTLVQSIKSTVKHEYYIVDLKRGELHETKMQVSNEND